MVLVTTVVEFQYFGTQNSKFPHNIYNYWILVPAAEIRDHETGLVSGPFSWFQSRQLFLETHETEANSVFYS